MGPVEILLWWLPPALVTLVAMLWVSWLGRARDVRPDRSEAAQERFAAAIMREMPHGVGPRTSIPRPVDRSTGIAVRPSQQPAPSRRDGAAGGDQADPSRWSA